MAVIGRQIARAHRRAKDEAVAGAGGGRLRQIGIAARKRPLIRDIDAHDIQPGGRQAAHIGGLGQALEPGRELSQQLAMQAEVARHGVHRSAGHKQKRRQLRPDRRGRRQQSRQRAIAAAHRKDIAAGCRLRS